MEGDKPKKSIYQTENKAIWVDRELAKELAILAIKHEVTLKKMTELALEDGIAAYEKKLKKNK